MAAAMYRAITVGNRHYELWHMHEPTESLVNGRELKRRAIEAGIRGLRSDREHFLKHPEDLVDFHGLFLHFTDDLDSDVLEGYIYTDGLRNWCPDQAELDHSSDRRSLHVRLAPPSLDHRYEPQAPPR